MSSNHDAHSDAAAAAFGLYRDRGDQDRPNERNDVEATDADGRTDCLFETKNNESYLSYEFSWSLGLIQGRCDANLTLILLDYLIKHIDQHPLSLGESGESQITIL